MDAKAYTDALKQRHVLRSDGNDRLRRLHAAAVTLTQVAGTIAADTPTLELTADPVAQIDPLVAEASALTQKIQAHDARTKSLRQALAVAREEAKRTATLRKVIIVIVVLAGLLTLFLVSGQH